MRRRFCSRRRPLDSCAAGCRLGNRVASLKMRQACPLESHAFSDSEYLPPLTLPSPPAIPLRAPGEMAPLNLPLALRPMGPQSCILSARQVILNPC
jgi:hypothetical protein